MSLPSTPRTLAAMGCTVIDLVLTGSFDWQELANLLPDRPEPMRPCPKCQCTPSTETLVRAHARVHDGGGFPAAIERQLDFRTRKLRRHVAALEPERLWRICGSADVTTCPDPAGLVWALLRDPRQDDVGPIGFALAARIQRAAFLQFHRRVADRDAPGLPLLDAPGSAHEVP